MTIELDDRRRRLALVAITTALVAGVLFLARGALFPFVLSGVIAYLLYPVVRALESWMPWRNRWPSASRITSVLLIYVLAIAAVAGALAIIVPPTVPTSLPIRRREAALSSQCRRAPGRALV